MSSGNDDVERGCDNERRVRMRRSDMHRYVETIDLVSMVIDNVSMVVES